jgi:dienelactone hydrolase
VPQNNHFAEPRKLSVTNVTRIQPEEATQIEITQINFTSQGKSITGELYTPVSITRAGLVMIAYGSDGMTNDLTGPWATMIRGYAESLAKSGLAAMIPNYLGVTGTHPGPGVLASIAKHRNQWQEAVSDAIDYAKSLATVDATRVGLLGFSLGAHLCLRLRAKANVLVEYFAPVLDGIGPAGTLTHAQIHHGEADQFPGTGFSNAQTIKEELEREGTSTELLGYPGAGHGFVGDDQANADARRLSKQRTLSFFKTRP